MARHLCKNNVQHNFCAGEYNQRIHHKQLSAANHAKTRQKTAADN